MNLTAPIHATARRWPDRAAVVEGEKTWCYRELIAAICRYRGLLRQRGIGPGQRVVIWLPNGIHFLVAHLGTMEEGVVSVAVKAESGPVELAAALADSGARLLITEEKLLARLPEGPPADVEVLLASEMPLAGPFEELPAVEVEEHHPAAVIYSYFFGEGRGYGAVLTHGNHDFAARHCARFHEIRSGDRVLVLLPMQHVYSIGVAILTSFYRGATVYVGKAVRPRGVLDTLTAERITHLPAVPHLLDAMAHYFDPERHDLGAIHHLISGADFLPATVHRKIAGKLGVPLVQGWGLTECFPAVCNPPDDRNRPGTLGIADHPRIAYRVVDAEGGELPASEVGEIEIRSPGVMAGYLEAPEATSRILRNGWLRTGDLGWVDEQGYLCFQGLKKPILNLYGNKVDPVEVAAVIEQLEGVERARVSAIDQGSGNGLADPVLWAEVTIGQPDEVTAKDIRTHCRAWLAPYKVPGKVELRPPA